MAAPFPSPPVNAFIAAVPFIPASIPPQSAAMTSENTTFSRKADSIRSMTTESKTGLVQKSVSMVDPHVMNSETVDISHPFVSSTFRENREIENII